MSGFCTQQFLLAVAGGNRKVQFLPGCWLYIQNTHKHTMNGTLFKYGPGSAQLAFKTPATRPRRPAGAPSSGELVLVLVGGLTDGKC